MDDKGYNILLFDKYTKELFLSILNLIDNEKEKKLLNQGVISFALIQSLVTLSAFYENKEDFEEFKSICLFWLEIAYKNMKEIKFDK